MENNEIIDESPIINVRTMKYLNKNNSLSQKQRNRFVQLFGNGKECNMLLVLRILNAYAMFGFTSPYLRNYTMEYNYIFDVLFWDKAKNSLLFNQNDVATVVATNEDDIPEMTDGDDVLIMTYDDIDDSTGDYSAQFNSNIAFVGVFGNPNISPDDRMQLSMNIFDCHFARQGSDVYFLCYVYKFNNVSYIVADDLEVPKNNVGRDFVPVLIDKNAYDFIDYYMSRTPCNFVVNREYWSIHRKTIFTNYISNFGLKFIFQYKKYTKCNINYLSKYGAGFEWDIKETLGLKNKLCKRE